jgi:AcrR family transcriptional regulator
MTTEVKARVKLTRERVVEAALRVMDAEGLDAVSMRRVARELGVEAMSLYNHVRDKDDLLAGICARVMSEYRIHDGGDNWLETARAAAAEWRRVLKQHPNVITVFAERREPVSDLGALEPMDHALGIIRQAGLSDRDATQVFNVFGGYIMGFVLMEVGQMFGAGAMDKKFPDPEMALQMIPREQLPNLAAAIPHMADCDPDEQFALGLDLLLAGMRVHFAPAGH